MGDAGRARPRGHLDPLRRAAGDRPDRHHAPDRLHLGQPLRLHRAGHLRADHDRVVRARRSTWSTTASRPRRCSSSPAMLVARRGSKRIPDFGGWQRVTPGLAGVVPRGRAVGPGAARGCARSSSEFLVLVGTFQRYEVAGGHRDPGIVLAALYILLMYKRMMTGPKPELDGAGAATSRCREKFVVAPLIAAFLVLGFYPKPALDILNPAVDQDAELRRRRRPGPHLRSTGARSEPAVTVLSTPTLRDRLPGRRRRLRRASPRCSSSSRVRSSGCSSRRSRRGGSATRSRWR